MIIDKEIFIKVNPKLDRTYFKLGYYNKDDCDGIFDLKIKIEDLNKSSRLYIKVKCDMCGIEKTISYLKYNDNINNHGIYACSPKCASFKNKLTCIKKYGNENYNNRDKCKITCLEKYGVDNVQKNEDIRKKSVDTIKNSYGYEIIMNKTRQHVIDKYDKEHALQVEEIMEKSKNTRKEKYGNENYNNRKKCKETNIEKYGVDNVQKSSILKEKKKEKIILTHPDIISIDDNFKYTIKCDCDKDHFFEILPEQYYQRKLSKTILCTICNEMGSSKSGLETLLHNFIKENYNNEILKNKRIIIKPLELDIYLPDLKLAFEFNGLYHHNELSVNNNYHLNKTELCEKQGIKLIHIYEDDWIYKQDIVKSRILNLLGKSNKIFARKCEIKEIYDNKIIREFLDRNHIQGFVGSKIEIGLFFDKELVSLMIFGELRKPLGQKSSKGTYEMLRFCNKLNINVIGGASRLFKYFIDQYKPNEIISYADRSWSQGDLYEKLDFKLVHKTKPNYYYVVDGIRKHRFNYRKDKLIKDGFDSNKTEHEIMLERGLFRIYDSGNLKYLYVI